MAFLTATIDQFRERTRCSASRLSSLVFVVLMLGWACVAKDLTIAVYSLSFWHYYLYWLAYYFGAVSLGVFKRDAIVMKTVSLAALSDAYLAAPPDLASLTVVACGFLLRRNHWGRRRDEPAINATIERGPEGDPGLGQSAVRVVCYN